MFNIYDEEIDLLLWTVALLFLVRSSGIFLNNYAETAFLKRYGVEYMPLVNMVNAVLTFFVMGVMTGFMTRLPGARLMARLFIFCGLSVAGIWAVIPFGIDLVYPALFMLKSQYEVLLALLFWNLANDLFNTRQSKRLFPLITAGGVIGQILSSFATPMVARWLNLDNLLLVYMGTVLIGAWVVHAMGRRFPTLLFQKTTASEKKTHSSIIEEFKTVLPLLKSSVLVKILVVVAFMANVVIPIMNYQFNYAVNEQFATEASLIKFFGYFRGVLNIVSLVILLFMGKLFDRFGLPVALMFHPFNYLLVFFAFLFRFDAVAAMYARMSANIIRTTINIPAMAVVTGLFPESYRAMIRPFLRGTVVRIGLFLGSGFILLSSDLFHPRYLSLVAMPFVLAWVVAIYILKRQYAGILLGLVSDNRIDFRSLDASELSQVFRDKRIQENFVQRFHQASGENCLWHGQLLRSISFPNFDTHLIATLRKEQDMQTRIGLIELFSDQAGPVVVEVFNELIETGEPDLVVAMIEAGHRISPNTFAPFNRRIFESSLPIEIKARAVGSLYTVVPAQFGPLIETWLISEDAGTRSAGVIAAGVCRDMRFAERLKTLLRSCDDDAMLLLILKSLRTINATSLNPIVVRRLLDPDPHMRRAVLEVYLIEDEASLKNVIALLGDDSVDIVKVAREKIKSADYQNSLRLIKSLSLPQKKVREALFDLLKDMAIKDLDIFRFVQLQARTCYQLTAQAKGIRQLSDGALKELLALHLDERVWFALQTTIRVLATQDRSGQMNQLAHGIFSTDQRQRANSLEAMDDILDKSIVRLLMPLLEHMDPAERIAVGRRLFPDDVKEQSIPALFENLLNSRNWITLVLTLTMMRQFETLSITPTRIKTLAGDSNPHVALLARQLMGKKSDHRPGRESEMDTTSSIPLTDKILHLKSIEIFSNLSINELATVATVTKEVAFDAGAQVFREGERGDTLYLVMDGDVAVVKGGKQEIEFELDSIGAGDYFGEMALFGDDQRSATIRVKKDSRFLTLNKEELQKIVREYPQIALHICGVLSLRIRHLHSRIVDQVC